MIRKPKPSLFRRFRKFISFQPHLEMYLQYISQTKDGRIKRLIDDKSYPTIQDQTLKKKSKSSLSKILNIRVFSPVQNLMLVWFILVFVAILYYYVEFGLVLTYGEQVWTDELSSPTYIVLDFLTCAIFLADIFVCLNCGFLYRGMVILDDIRITRKYFAYNFFIDTLSFLIVVICPASGVYVLNYLKLFLLLKLLRLSDIDDFFLRKFNIHRVGKALYVIFKMVVIIFLLSHFLGLIFYAMDYYYLTSGIYPPELCWLEVSTAYSPIIELSYPLQYLYTLYWGVNTITTISYGDIAPLNPPETNFVIASFCFGFMVYAYIVNQIIKIILWAREDEQQFNSDMILMETYMNKMGISKKLKENVTDYLKFLHKEEKDRDLELERAMRQKIPEHLRIQLLKSAYSIFYEKMLNIFETEEIIKIFFSLSERQYTNNQTIFEQSSRASTLFLLTKGTVSLKINQGAKTHTIFTTVAQNQLIGHYQMLSNQKWLFTAVAKKSSLIYSIDRIKIMNEINTNLILREKIKLIEYELTYKQNCKIIFHSCYFCYENHNFRNCPKKFPIFNPHISIENNEKSHQRQKPRLKQNGMRALSELEDIHKLHQNKNFKLIMKIEKRLGKIKKKIDKNKREFEIDTAFDWTLYEPDLNLSNLKDRWNQKTVEKIEELKKNVWKNQ